MIVGMDFGTTNSGMAIFDGQKVQILPLDPSSANPGVLRTALYITNEQAVHIGRAAVDRYYDQNIGRVVKTRKVWIGEIEVFAEDLYYVTDAYAWIDISEPGRLLLSVKTRLREDDHPGAVVGQYFYTLEDLIALYLNVVKLRAERMLGKKIRQVVLGRPVRFSTDEEHDRLAQGRLLQAAFRAGYEQVYLQYEPVAAALSYETTLDRPQNVLVFDFGGGTLDITVMRLGDPAGRQVLSTGGIPVAGDIFDRKMTRVKLPKHFGEDSLYGPRHNAKKVPRWIYDAFSDWQTIIELQSQENRRILEDIARTAQRRYQIQALISLVTSNYGLKMFDQVEMAKRLLSEKRGAEIRLDGPDFKVREFATRTEFEHIIHSDILAIEAELKRTVDASGLDPKQIDAVIRTGGSAQIPIFFEMLARTFTPDKVQTIDTFSSVTAGLGVYAHRIETGEITAKPYTPDDVIPPPQAIGSQPKISQVNLDLMKKWIFMSEGIVHQESVREHPLLVILGEGNMLTAVSMPLSSFQQTNPIPFADYGFTGSVKAAILTSLDEQMLLVTSTYRFLLTTPRQLLDLQSMDMSISDLHRMAERETLCTLSSWTHILEQEHLMLATTRGFVRAFPVPIMRDNIEAPVPLKLDHPLPGLPVLTHGALSEDEFVLITAHGRGLRWSVNSLRVTGTQVANCGKEDHIAAAALAKPNEELLLLTNDGFANRLLAGWIPILDKPNRKGKSLIARRSLIAALAKPNDLVLTDRNLLAIRTDALPLENSTKSVPIFKLEDDGHIRGALSVPVE
jgi:hypothetical chaperone protein